MTNSSTTSDTHIDLSALRLQLTSGSERVQQQLIQQLAILGNPGLDVLMEFLLQRQANSPTWIDGKVYHVLHAANYSPAQEFLQTYFPNGIVTLKSECDIDYNPLQQLLIAQDFQAADRMTLQMLCELAGSAAVQRKWLYFTEVENFYKRTKIFPDILELRNLVACAHIIIKSATMRKESRGLHYTIDYPEKDEKADYTLIQNINP